MLCLFLAVKRLRTLFRHRVQLKASASGAYKEPSPLPFLDQELATLRSEESAANHRLDLHETASACIGSLSVMEEWATGDEKKRCFPRSLLSLFGCWNRVGSKAARLWRFRLCLRSADFCSLLSQ